MLLALFVVKTIRDPGYADHFPCSLYVYCKPLDMALLIAICRPFCRVTESLRLVKAPKHLESLNARRTQSFLILCLLL